MLLNTLRIVKHASTDELIATGSAREVSLPSQRSVITAGRRALAAYTSTNGPLAEASCAWTDSTLLIGAITFAKHVRVHTR